MAHGYIHRRHPEINVKLLLGQKAFQYQRATTTGISLTGTATTGIVLGGTETTGIATSGTGVKRFGLISTKETATTTDAYDLSFKLTHTNNAALTAGRLSAMFINLEPKAGVDAYKIVGAEISSYLGTATVSGPVTGLYVETQGGTTLGSDYYSLYVYADPDAVPVGSSAVMRLKNNPGAIID